MSVERAELEIVHRPDDLLVHPLTGECLDLTTAPDDRLAAFLSDLRDHERVLREAKQIVTDEALRRLDRNANWTLRAGPYVIKSQSPAPVEEFDDLALRSELLALVDEGVLSIEAVDKAVETVITYKVRKAGINALRKLGGRIREIVDAHARDTERTRYVTVQRVGR